MGSRYVIFRMWSLCEELGISRLKEPIASADGGGRPGQSTCMEQLLGTGELLGKKGKTPVSALASKEVVGLYFSAHWCVLPVPRAPRASERARESVSG